MIISYIFRNLIYSDISECLYLKKTQFFDNFFLQFIGYVLVHDYRFCPSGFIHIRFFYYINAANAGLRRRLFATVGFSRNSKIRGKGLVNNIENNDYFK